MRLLRWLAKQWWAPVTVHERAFGVTLWRWRRVKVELWYAPANYYTLEHTHQFSDGEFTLLWARQRQIYRIVNGRLDSYMANTPAAWGRWLTVRAGTPHAFAKGESCMIWIVVQRWKPGVSVTSLAEDFHLT